MVEHVVGVPAQHDLAMRVVDHRPGDHDLGRSGKLGRISDEWIGRSMTKWVYSFGDGKAEGQSSMKDLLGGKGANLAEMSNLGLPVPPGFTVTTGLCTVSIPPS